MESNDYPIVCASPAEQDRHIEDGITIYNLKLTEELVEKLMKGQKNFDDLDGVEFIMSNSEKGIDVRRVCL